MIIDCHAHFVPEGMLDALKKDVRLFSSVELLHSNDEYRLSFAGKAPTRAISTNLRHIDTRLEWMTEKDVDAQVVGGWLDAFGYELSIGECASWSRFMNEWLWSATERVTNLVPLATVPLQSGKAAARILREALAAGFSGTMIGTLPSGDAGNLDSSDLDPFWQEASDLNATVFIHPMFGCRDARLADYELVNAVGRGMDTTAAVARLLCSGHLLKYRGVKIVVAHGGGGIPYLLGRLARNHAIHADQIANPVNGFERMYFDSVVFDPRALRFLRECAGSDHIVLGSDYPFPIGDPDPVAVVREAGLGDPDTQLILGGTASKLFAIEAP